MKFIDLCLSYCIVTVACHSSCERAGLFVSAVIMNGKVGLEIRNSISR